MNKQKLFRTAGLSALAAALTASPALASEEDAKEEIASEAQGTFAGFETAGEIMSVEMRRIELSFDDAGIERTSRGFDIELQPEVFVRDDVGLINSIDFADTVPSSVQIFLDVAGAGIFFNCTGTLINPRTVLTAAHCVNSFSSEDYGLSGDAPITPVVSTGFDTFPRIANYAFNGLNYAEGGSVQGSDVVIHPSGADADGALPFPWADVALIALAEPVTDVPYAPLLLSPLTELTHVVVNGYGSNGTGDGGAVNLNFYRIVGENMLGAIASTADYVDVNQPAFAPTAQFGVTSQVFYMIDFDNPNRTDDWETQCTFDPFFGPSCPTPELEDDFDWFDGDALPNEAGTAPGDSGSALIADEIHDFPLVTAVLSGGLGYFDLSDNGYGDISFYTPLFPFFEFISENTPYKYVSALAGDGRWSDPNHWTQDLDPGFFISDGNGGYVNGIPEGSELGIYETGPKLGTILGQDISGNPDLVSAGLPPFGTPGFGPFLPESSVLLGPGSTGFVPNNTDGVVGTAFENPAQYFDVLLLNPGTTSVDMDVTIDRLTIDGADTGFNLKRNKEFNSLISVEQYNGSSTINGTLNSPVVYLIGGLMDGSGTINTNLLFNINGGLSIGDFENIRTLTVNGDYVQTSGGVMFVDVKPQGLGNSSDLLNINGDASLAGILAVSALGNANFEYGTQYTVLQADSVLGQFDSVASLVDSPVLYFEQVVGADSIAIEVKAHSIASLVGAESSLASLGSTLDTLRFSGRYGQFQGLFSAVDNAGFAQFGATLGGLTPLSGFAQSSTATNFAMRFTGQLAQRTLTLRGAGKAASGFSSYGSASFAQAGTMPEIDGKLGFFGSVSGSFLTNARERSTGSKALEEAAFTQAGELTLGADYKLSDSVSFGLAISNVRDGAAGTGGLQPENNQSTSLAAYSAVSFGKGFADLYLGYADQQFGLSRDSQGALAEEFNRAVGFARGEQTMAGIRVGYAFEPASGVALGPVASLDYVRSDLNGYREFGAGAFGLNVHDRTFTSLGTKLGAMGAVDLKVGQKGKLTAFSSVAYARELGDSEDVVTASFAGAEDLPFSIARQLDTDWMAVNAGAELLLSDSLSTRMSVTSDIGRGVLSGNQANLELRWAF